MGIIKWLKNIIGIKNSKMVTLRAFGISATINIDNGQLSSMKHRGVEYIYQQNGLWKNSYIHMFPVCFRLKDNVYLFDGKEITMKNHGIWRDFKWNIVQQSKKTLELKASNISNFAHVYPFKFEARILFNVSEEGVSVNCHIKNIDEQRMYFNFGHHPAFITYNSNKHPYIKFESKEQIEAIHASYRESNPRIENEEVIDIIKFDWETVNSFLIQNSSTQNIRYFNGKSVLNIRTKAPHLMLWKPTNKSKFIAIEPSYGLPDRETQEPKPINEKTGIQSLMPDQEFVDQLHFSFN